ncbi:hypothetical protein M1146_04125, partial [Patescibacteria group bacterium]|nr:hypothetical protein [Patescibacteria group bacterium]
FKKLLITTEDEIVHAVEVLGASRDKIEEDLRAKQLPEYESLLSTLKEGFITVAIGLVKKVSIYCIDIMEMKGVKTYELVHDFPMYITDLTCLRTPDVRSVNYASLKSTSSNPLGHQLIAVTDEGKIIVWETDKLRFQSEKKLRQHFKVVLEKPHTGHNRRRRSDPQSADLSSPNGVHTSQSLTAPFFVTEDPKSVVVETKEKDNSRGHSRAKTPHSSSATGHSGWLELPSKELFCIAVACLADYKKAKKNPVTPKDCVLNSAKIWSAHTDLIPSVVPLHAHGCFISVSHDGYHRVWNLDMECLGELVLPNVTEYMKSQSRCKEPGSQWKFILERIPVTKIHVELATSLVRQIRMLKENFRDFHTGDRNRHGTLPFGFKGFRDTSVTEEVTDVKDMTRKVILKKLSEPPPVSEDIPPSRLPTKEEKELIKLSLLNNSGSRLAQSSLTASSEGFPVLGNTLDTMSSVNLLPSTSLSPLPSNILTARAKNEAKKKKHESALRSSLMFAGDSSVCLSCFGVPSLWTVPGEKDIFGNTVQQGSANVPVQQVAPAFSDTSIANLMREGLIDTEGHHILRTIAKNHDRVQVYDRSQPTLLIRNPMMSTSVQLPAIDSIKKTEIYFGPQKDMYKNAEKILNEKKEISKLAMRTAVSNGRIEQSVRKVNSMVHLIQPPAHDEVILPKSNTNTNADDDDDDNGGYHGDDKNRSEDNKMKIRLMKSAAMVPSDATIHMRPLDHRSIDRWVNRMNSALDLPMTTNSFNYRTKSDPGSPNSRLFGSTKRRGKKEIISQAAVLAVEKKLGLAIKGEHKARVAANKAAALAQASSLEAKTIDPNDDISINSNNLIPELNNTNHHGDYDDLDDEDEDEANHPTSPTAKGSPKKEQGTLTTRQLLPYYKLESVHQFMDIFAKVDENFSGDLDVNEWIRLFVIW